VKPTKLSLERKAVQWERLLESAPHKETRGHRHALLKKRKGTLWQYFFSSRVVDLWTGLNDCTVSVETITALNRERCGIVVFLSLPG